jgi:hypothetical protein
MTASMGPGGRAATSSSRRAVDGTGRARGNQQLAEGGGDAARDVDGGRCLDGVHDGVAVEQHGVGVGAADVDADAPHANTERKSRS